MRFSFLTRAAVAAAISLPVGVFVPAVTGVGATAAHAALECVGVDSSDMLVLHSGDCTDPGTVEVNVCDGTQDHGTDPPAEAGADTTVWVLGTPIDVEAWENGLSGLSPTGELEVDDVGIASAQQGC